MAKPNKSAPLGEGGRFAYVEEQARKSGASNPAAVAAQAGMNKYGKKKMHQLSLKGKMTNG